MSDRKTIIILLCAVIYATALFYDVHLQRTFDLSKLRALYVSAGAVLVFWVLGWHGIRVKPKDWLMVSIVLMLLTGLVSALLAINTDISFKGCPYRYDGFYQFCVYIFLFFAVTNFIQAKHFDHIFTAIIVCGCVASVYGVLQRHGIDLWGWADEFGGTGTKRAMSTFGHPAFFAAWLATMFPLILYKIFSRGMLWFVPLILILLALNYTQTRAAFVALFVSCAFFFWFTRREWLARKKKIIIVGLGVALAVGLFVGATSHRTITSRFVKEFGSTGFLNNQGSVYARIKGYGVAWKVIKDYPYWGTGQDCVCLVYQRYLAEGYKEYSRGNFDRAHCWPIDIAQHRGFIGLAAFIVFVCAFGRMVWRHCKAGDMTVVTLTACCIAYAVQNLFSFQMIPIGVLFWYMVGMAFVACRKEILCKYME